MTSSGSDFVFSALRLVAMSWVRPFRLPSLLVFAGVLLCVFRARRSLFCWPFCFCCANKGRLVIIFFLFVPEHPSTATFCTRQEKKKGVRLQVKEPKNTNTTTTQQKEETNNMAAKPKVLVLGGVGFIGRNLVTYLVESDLCSYIRVVDKVLPATAFLGAPHAAAFANPIVDYKQCNLASDAGVNRAFTLEEAGAKFDVVVNLAAETKYGQTDEVCFQHSPFCTLPFPFPPLASRSSPPFTKKQTTQHKTQNFLCSPVFVSVSLCVYLSNTFMMLGLQREDPRPLRQGCPGCRPLPGWSLH